MLASRPLSVALGGPVAWSTTMRTQRILTGYGGLPTGDGRL